MRMETPRLLVRDFRAEDAPALFAVLSDPAVMRYLEPPFSLEQTQRFLHRAGLCRPPQIFAVEEKLSGALIGHLIWHPWEENAMELGWVLRRDCWGRGYASELTEALLAGADRDIVIECSPQQTATVQIAERFGFMRCSPIGELAVYRFRK